MKVEIWSDIMCPFCYIGKRNFEQAMQQFAHKNDIELIWKSYQLDPTIPLERTDSESVYSYLAKRKGWSLEQTKKMHEGLIQTAKNAGLDYNFDKAVVANSFNAHRLIQMAKTKGLGDKAEERFFFAYFTEGKDIGDTAVLLELGLEMGLSENEINSALAESTYAQSVKADIKEAQEIGVNGVPFFVFNRRYAVSGAQPAEAFLETLNVSFAEWRKDNPKSQFEIIQGEVCTPDGDCA